MRLLLTALVSFCLQSLAASSPENVDNYFQMLEDLSAPGSLTSYMNSSGLLTRQKSGCTAGPGGPICSPTTCCPAGYNCLKDSCCPIGDNTCGGKTCCKPASICCSSSPIGCCPADSVCCPSTAQPCCPTGTTCCGNGCCPAGYACERGECVDESIIKSKRIVRMEYNKKKNGCVLVNMCNGMRGKNTIELTYEYLDDKAKNQKRKDAGCIDSYCANIKVGPDNKPLAEFGLNSCDEFPPASSLEGGKGTPNVLHRAINCIPGRQNSWQGGKFSRLRRWQKIQTGDKWVISIDCDKVLGPNTAPCDQYPYPQHLIERREVIDISNVTTEDDYFPGSLTPEAPENIFILPFGDLGPGQYNATYKIVAGSVLGSYIVDNMGDDISIPDETKVSSGQSKTMSFSINATGALMGVGMLLVVPDNSTKVEWSFKGQDLPLNSPTSAGGSPGPSNTPSSNSSPQLVGSMWGYAVTSSIATLLTGCIYVIL